MIDSFGRWAIEWLFEDLRPHDVPPTTLMWWMHRRVDPTRFPPHRTVIEWRHTAPSPEVIWLVLDRGEVSVCMVHPGFDVDVVVSGTTATFGEVFQGFLTWREAVDAGRIDVVGPPRLVSRLPGWFLWSPWAEVTRERADRARAASGATT